MKLQTNRDDLIECFCMSENKHLLRIHEYEGSSIEIELSSYDVQELINDLKDCLLSQ